MDFPAVLSLKVLEQMHPAYSAIAPTLVRIDDLAAGGWQLERKKALYLPPRPGEEKELYKLRLEKFTYTNTLGGAIAQQANKMSSGTLTISGIEPHQDFWNEWREATNRKGRSEKDLLADAFRAALKFQRCFLHVEKPYSEYEPQTRQQEELLGLRPYVCLYTPMEVVDWEERETGLEWLKVRQLRIRSRPFGRPLNVATWTYITPEYTAKYEAFVKLGKKGAIAEIVNEQGDSVDSGEDAKVSLQRLVAHGVGQLPVVKLELPEDLWVTNQAYLKALEHLRLENSRSDTAEMVGYVQRTFRPHVTPDTDLDHTFVDADDDLKSGNQYIIKGDFGFSEATGSSVVTVSALLQEIRDTIQDMIGLARASATRGAIEQSGLSKKMDFVIQELVLKAYGVLVCDRYQDLLQLVGRMAGFSDEEVASISVSGLDSFDVDSLDTMLAIAVEMQPVLYLIPATVLRMFVEQLSGLLVRNTSPEQQEQIKSELEALFAAGTPAPPMAVQPGAIA